MAQKPKHNQVFEIEAKGTMYPLTASDVTTEQIARRERELLKARREKGCVDLEYQTEIYKQKSSAQNTPEWEKATHRSGELGARKDVLLNEIFQLEGLIQASRTLAGMLSSMKHQEV